MSLKKCRLRSCRLFVSASFLFFLFLEKMVGIPMQKVSYVMFKVAVEIANICFVLLSLSAHGGCAASLREGSFVFICAQFAGVCSLCDFTLHLCQFRWFICTLVGI